MGQADLINKGINGIQSQRMLCLGFSEFELYTGNLERDKEITIFVERY